MRLDRVAVEVGVDDRPRIHRDRPALAAALGPNPKSCVQFRPQRRGDLRRRQDAPHDAPRRVPFLRPGLGPVVIEAVLPPRPLAVQLDEPIIVGKAPEQKPIEVVRKKVAEENERVRRLEQLRIENRVGRRFEDRAKSLVRRRRRQRSRPFVDTGPVHCAHLSRKAFARRAPLWRIGAVEGSPLPPAATFGRSA